MAYAAIKFDSDIYVTLSPYITIRNKNIPKPINIPDMRDSILGWVLLESSYYSIRNIIYERHQHKIKKTK